MTVLASGTIPTTQGDLFALNRGPFQQKKNARIDKITFFNNDPVAQTAILSVLEFVGTPRTLRQFVLQQNEGGEYLEPGETLELRNGDSLQGITTTAAAVDYVIVGERVQ